MPNGVQEARLELHSGFRAISPLAIVGITGLLLLATPWVGGWFVQADWQPGYVLLLALATTLGVTPLMIWAGHHWGVVDVPAERKIHSQATPRLGGLAVYVGLMVAFWFGSGLREQGLITIVMASSLLLAVGLIDDLRNLSAFLRLAAQLVGAGLVVSSGTVLTLFPTEWLGNVPNILLTLLWIVGITNAFNFFDGMDGLATGLAILMCVFMGFVAFETNQPGLGLLALAIVGAGLGFLPYNFRVKGPAHIFLGENGSTFLGFLLACLAVQGEWADSDPIVSFSNPLLIFGVLIFDMVHTTVERVATGKVRSFRGWLEFVGKDHLHHRLERILGSRLASVSMIFALTICLGLAALVLRQAGTAEALVLLTQACLIVMMITILEHAGRR